MSLLCNPMRMRIMPDNTERLPALAPEGCPFAQRLRCRPVRHRPVRTEISRKHSMA